MRTRTGRIVSALSGACLCLLLAPLTAAAQNSAALPAQNARGPMIVERVKGGFVLAPDFKITEVNNTTSDLVGAYGGWLFDGQLLIGGGGSADDPKQETTIRSRRRGCRGDSARRHLRRADSATDLARSGHTSSPVER